MTTALRWGRTQVCRGFARNTPDEWSIRNRRELFGSCADTQSVQTQLTVWHLRWKHPLNKIKKCRSKAAKPFRISITNEKQSWKLDECASAKGLGRSERAAVIQAVEDHPRHWGN
jgi:hypothetical protein